MNNIFSWAKGFDGQRILRNIAKCRSIDAASGVAFKSHEYRFWLPVLLSSIQVPSSEEIFKLKCIESALNDPLLQINDGKKFLSFCNEKYEISRVKQKSHFSMLSSMTYSGKKLFSDLYDGDFSIKWHENSNAPFMRSAVCARDSIAERRRNYSVPDQPGNFSNLVVQVSAYGPFHAHELAIDSLDSMRGMLNLFVNAATGLNPFGFLNRPHAINRLRAGPFSTIHNLDGSLAANVFWYEHRWLHDRQSINFKGSDNGEFQKIFRKLWSKFQRNKLRNHIRKGLIRYCRALDLHDPVPSLIELWGALEGLTGTQHEKYDVTIDRTVKVFADHQEARQIANHVRFRRNSAVHAAQTMEQNESDVILMHAEDLVRNVIIFAINNGGKFINEQEFFDFLDLPIDSIKLNREIAIRRISLKIEEK
jgi:hypothetical protein